MKTSTDHLEAEQALLGAMILDNRQIGTAEAAVSPSDFDHPPHGRLFGLVCDMAASGQTVDSLTLVPACRAAGILEGVGGVGGIAKLIAAVPDPRHLIAYAREVRLAADRRAMSRLARQFADRAESGDADPSDLSGWLEGQLVRFTSRTESSTILLADAVRQRIATIRELKATKTNPAITTGIADLDDAVGGMYSGELVILAARPSVGKSALGVQVGIAAAEQSCPTLFVSLEMTSGDLANRQLAARLGAENRAVRSGILNDADLADADRYADSIADIPFHILSSRSASMKTIRASARIAKATSGLRCLIVDYLGLIRVADRRKPRWESMTEISGELKSLALELSVPVLALCQLNREAEGSTPTLAHLRDAGAIEQDADVVLLLDRKTRDATEATLIVAKARNAETGSITLNFDPGSCTFAGRCYEWTQ